jgi:hypothetical protein
MDEDYVQCIKIFHGFLTCIKLEYLGDHTFMSTNDKPFFLNSQDLTCD